MLGESTSNVSQAPAYRSELAMTRNAPIRAKMNAL
jgi:hypothetical protein